MNLKEFREEQVLIDKYKEEEFNINMEIMHLEEDREAKIRAINLKYEKMIDKIKAKMKKDVCPHNLILKTVLLSSDVSYFSDYYELYYPSYICLKCGNLYWDEKEIPEYADIIEFKKVISYNEGFDLVQELKSIIADLSEKLDMDAVKDYLQDYLDKREVLKKERK